MTRFDRYLLREWLEMLGLVLGGCMGLLFIQALYDDFRGMLELGAATRDVVVYFLVKLPGYLSIVLPLALLVSTLYVLGRMHRNLEFTAMRAAGVGMVRLMRVLWIAGLVLCGVTWMLNSTVVPWSVEATRRVWQQLEYQHEVKGADITGAGIVRGLAFDNRQDNRMWFFNRYSRVAHRGYGVMISELDDERRERTRYFAEEARYDGQTGSWTLFAGQEIWFDPETGEVLRPIRFAEKKLSYWHEDPDLMLIFDVPTADLSFWELRELIDHVTNEQNPKLPGYLMRYFGIIGDTLGPLIILAIAIPFAVSGVRVNPVVGVSKALFLFMVYFVLLKLTAGLGSREVIPPLGAALAPNIAMLLVGIGLLGRVR